MRPISLTGLPSLTDAAVLLQNASCWDDDKAQSVQVCLAAGRGADSGVGSLRLHRRSSRLHTRFLRQQWFADLLHYIRVDGYNIMHREEDMMNNHG